ncbi:MAG: hypothetical protein J6A37_14310, partial [Oscillospiraceae bacterium]|nr:hypothetical protein [Oscillospiraceae bacterium]
MSIDLLEHLCYNNNTLKIPSAVQQCSAKNKFLALRIYNYALRITNYALLRLHYAENCELGVCTALGKLYFNG